MTHLIFRGMLIHRANPRFGAEYRRTDEESRGRVCDLRVAPVDRVERAGRRGTGAR